MSKNSFNTDDFLDEIRLMIANIPGHISHSNMSKETKNEIQALREELKEIRFQTEKGNSIDSKIEVQMQHLVQSMQEVKNALKTEYLTGKEFSLEKKNIEDKIEQNKVTLTSFKKIGVTVLVPVLLDIIMRVISVAYN